MGEKLPWFGKPYQRFCAHGAYVAIKWQNRMKISLIIPIQEVWQAKGPLKTAYSKADYNGIAGASLTDSGYSETLSQNRARGFPLRNPPPAFADSPRLRSLRERETKGGL